MGRSIIAPIFCKAWCVVSLPPYHLKSPEVGLITFSTIPRVVDLPLPLGPKSPYTFPFISFKEIELTAIKLLYFFVRLLSSRSGVVICIKLKRLEALFVTSNLTFGIISFRSLAKIPLKTLKVKTLFLKKPIDEREVNI